MSQSLPNVTADVAVFVLSALIVLFADSFAWHSRRPALTARARLSIWDVAPVGPSTVSRVDVRARPSCSSLTRTSPVSRKTPGRESRTESAVLRSNLGSEAFTRLSASGSSLPAKST